MLKKAAFAIAGLLAFQTSAYAKGHWAVEGTVVTSGVVAVDLVRYEKAYEAGVSFGGKFNNSSSRTSMFSAAVFGGLRYFIAPKTVFVYGISVASLFGRDNGAKINASYSIAPYISVEQYLSEKVLVSVWIDPYQYQYDKKDGVCTSTNRIFNAGGLGVSYLFD
ncbi:MAG: hypothetical protein WCW01_03430 [Gammaproteobacteria bacterium]|jgi:hypothetical protein